MHFAAGDLVAARDALVNEVLGYAAYRGTRSALACRSYGSCRSCALQPCARSRDARIGGAPGLRVSGKSRWSLSAQLDSRPAFSAGIKVVVVFDATTSAQFEAQRESLSEHVDVVFAAGGACVQLSSSHALLAGGARNGL